MSRKSHHFHGISQYADQLMDLADGRPAFSGRGQKPSNKEVLAAIASINKCRQGSFFNTANKPCSCGWHTKAVARKKARQSAASTTINSSHSDSPAQSTAGTCSSLSDSTLSTAGAGSPSPSIQSDPPKVGSGPVPPKFDKKDFQTPTISELRVIGIGTITSPRQLDLLVYCPLKGKCPHCKSALITANSVGKRKLCYAIPWPKTIVGVDMKCGNCKKHFMTHDTKYVDTLPSAEQVKRQFVTAKGSGSHISLLRLLRSGLTVAQVERYVEDEIQEHYLQMKAKYIELWDKVFTTKIYIVFFAITCCEMTCIHTYLP